MGAHIQVSWQSELHKMMGRGGTLVVPLCNACHNCYGGEIRLRETKALIDRGCPLDLRGMLAEALPGRTARA